MFTPIRSRSDKAIGDTLEGKWMIVAKRVIAEPTPRTPYEAPRLGIYDYEVVPHANAAPTPIPAAASKRAAQRLASPE
jgi:hypothetical protein